MTDVATVEPVECEADEPRSRVDRTEPSELDLLARLSHEMRTPLSAILGFAQLMESGMPAPTVAQKRSIGLILEAGWYLDKLINMTCDLALLESGALSLSLDPVPLASIMRDCQTLIESQAQVHGVRVTFPVFESPCFVLADGIRLQQALGHWLSAAIECSEVDAAVIVDCEIRSPEWIRIGISDGGEDLSADPRTRRFPPRDRLQHEATAMNPTGICLLLARRLVELMGGAVRAVSPAGAGNLFSFDLKRMSMPLAAGGTSAHPSLEQPASAGGAPAHSTVHSSDAHAHPDR